MMIEKLAEKDVYIMPIQPIDNGRFISNRIVRMLLDTHPTMDMNSIAMMPFTNQERTQFAQLIGYSLSGFGELGYVDDETYNTAIEIEGDGAAEGEARITALRNQIKGIKAGVEIINASLDEGE